MPSIENAEETERDTRSNAALEAVLQNPFNTRDSQVAAVTSGSHPEPRQWWIETSGSVLV